MTKEQTKRTDPKVQSRKLGILIKSEAFSRWRKTFRKMQKNMLTMLTNAAVMCFLFSFFSLWKCVMNMLLFNICYMCCTKDHINASLLVFSKELNSLKISFNTQCRFSSELFLF